MKQKKEISNNDAIPPLGVRGPSRILIIYTGGTIGMTHDHETGVLIPFDFGNVDERIPELKRFDCKFDFIAFHPLIDSSDMQPEKWVEIARYIYKNYNTYNGFIILHGTDTMAYTASALSFMLENLGKPVILTGSQLPLESLRTDARSNLITSVEIICNHSQHIPSINEVCIFFDNMLLRGNRSEKFTSSKFDAFRSANYDALAEAGVEIVYHENEFLKSPTKKFLIHEKLDNNIALLKIFPGITQKFIDAVLKVRGLKALVLETFGSGNAPTRKEFLVSLKEAIDKGIIIVNVSQCSGGSVHLEKYANSKPLQKIGVISAGDMSTEATLTKLMFLFGKGLNKIQVEKMMQKNLRGELTE